MDASACSLLSEDWGPGTTRFHFQRELIACQSRACLSDSGRRRFLELPHGARGGEQQQQVVLITSSGGKAAVALHPSPEAAALQQALAGVRPDGEANLEAALKLALVGAAAVTCLRLSMRLSLPLPLSSIAAVDVRPDLAVPQAVSRCAIGGMCRMCPRSHPPFPTPLPLVHACSW